MTIITDYTKEACEDSLVCANLDKYRFSHWLCNIMQNFFSSPLNIKDERLHKLLFVQDGIDSDQCRALIRVGLPLEKDSRTACGTPAILVSATEAQYPVTPINFGIPSVDGAIGATQMGQSFMPRKLGGQVAVITEALDGTYLLSEIIEMFMVANRHLFQRDNGAISQFNVLGSSGVQMLQTGQAGNAKELYQDVISISVVGTVSYALDTQGPIFRGLERKTNIK
jgi:hypothetical protein